MVWELSHDIVLTSNGLGLNFRGITGFSSSTAIDIHCTVVPREGRTQASCTNFDRCPWTIRRDVVENARIPRLPKRNETTPNIVRMDILCFIFVCVVLPHKRQVSGKQDCTVRGLVLVLLSSTHHPSKFVAFTSAEDGQTVR